MMELAAKHYKEMLQALKRITDLHSSQEITLPDGSWGSNCKHCDGWEYPCATITAMLGRDK